MSDIRAVYRLQVRNGTTFAEAAELIPQLAELGVSHLYLSPVLQAATGSSHGYDVVDPSRVDAGLGGEEGFAELHRAAADAGLGLVVDIVPNHMAMTTPDNAWWWDVLARGPDSDFADVFDIDWARGPHGQPQVLVPVLGSPLLDELKIDGAVRLRRRDGDLVVAYHEHLFPVADGTLAAAGLDPDDPDGCVDIVARDPARLLPVLDRQFYALANWRRGHTELNYRRFFDITSLGGIRLEDPDVFDRTHGRILTMIRDGQIDGLRIDHPDGLRDPVGYLERLRAAAPDTWIVIEKILEPGEERRTSWPVDGTVGYAFANEVLGLFVDPGALGALTALSSQITGRDDDFEHIVESAKRQVVGELFTPEVDRLVSLLEAATAEIGAVVTSDLRRALVELLVAFPVYRTYLRPGAGRIEDDDRHTLSAAVAVARVHLGDDDALDAIGDVMGLGGSPPEPGTAAADFVARLQQLTGPVMAKGVEDTAFYRDVRFVAANEVGGDPRRLGRSIGSFHAANQARQRAWPRTLLTTSTHDTKRSEDVRARLAVASELPDAWVRAVHEWRGLLARHVGERGPSPGHELLLLQTLVGAWPITADRTVDYLRKAAREGKQHTHWLDVDEPYERDLERCVRGALSDEEFVASIEAFVARIREPGWLNSLAQTLLRLTSPGIPDVYQGAELWDLSLVDPDNRRPVDHRVRAHLLAQLRQELEPEDILAGMDQGLPKLWVIRQALAVRRDRAASVGPGGEYTPVWPTGERSAHLVAFLRGDDVLTIAPRLVVGLGGEFLTWDWRDTQLPVPPGRWREVMSGTVHDIGDEPVPLSMLLNRFPVALLVADDA